MSHQSLVPEGGEADKTRLLDESGSDENSEEIANWMHVHKSRTRRAVSGRKHLLEAYLNEDIENLRKKTWTKGEETETEGEKPQIVKGKKKKPAIDPQLQEEFEELKLNIIFNEETLNSREWEIRQLRRNLRESGLRIKAVQEASVRNLEEIIERLSTLEAHSNLRSSQLSLTLASSSVLRTSFVSPRSYFHSPRERDSSPAKERRRFEYESPPTPARNGGRTPSMSIIRTRSHGSAFNV